MNSRIILLLAAVLGGVGIIIGAFGAHSLPSLLKDSAESVVLERTEWLETGVKYHMYHAIALMALAFASEKFGKLSSVGMCWIVGVLIFSGCLYAMSITGIRWLGAIVPLGGVSFIVGWGLLALKALRQGPS